MKVPLCLPDVGRREARAVAKVLESGWLTSGPLVESFEQKFAAFIGQAYAVAVNSCASALLLALRALDIHGEVILPSFTHPATANAVVNAEAIPVFADICPSTYNVDPEDVARKITSRTEAIMPVHFAGQSCQMDRLAAIAQRHGLAIIEDSAEAIGATFQGQKTGTFGVGCFSFFPTKNMTTGEGGMLVTRSEQLATRARRLAAHGVIKTGAWRRTAVEPGYNFRMSDIAAAIGLVQLAKLPEMNACRVAHAEHYNRSLPADELWLPKMLPERKHVYQMYVVGLRDFTRRENLLEFLWKNEIEASVHFSPPAHWQPAYRSSLSLPVTEKAAASVVTLPMFPGMTADQRDFVVEKVNEFFS